MAAASAKSNKVAYKTHGIKPGDYLYAWQMVEIDDTIAALCQFTGLSEKDLKLLKEMAGITDDKVNNFASGVDATSSEYNLNTITVPGMYIVGPETQNNPLNDIGYLIVYGDEKGPGSILCQLIISKDGAIYSRYYQNLIWSPWHSSITTKEVEDIMKHIKISPEQIAVDNLLVEDVLQIGKSGITRIANDTITTDTVISRLVQADEADFKQMTADSGLVRGVLQVGESGITRIANDTIRTDTIISNIVNASTADFVNLTSETAFVEKMLQVGEDGITKITNNKITTNTIVARLAEIDKVNADTIFANTEFVNHITSISNTSVNSIVDAEYVKSLVAGYVAVGDLKAGDITVSNKAKILSENGAMVMDGTKLQVIGTKDNGEEYVAIQLGYDTESKPSLIITNTEGAVIVSPDGITQEGITKNSIAPGLIDNNMIEKGSINKDRLSFNVLTDQDTISLAQVYDGSGGNFGVEYTNFKNATNIALNDLSKDENATFIVRIESPKGVNTYGGNIDFFAHLFRNSVEVTDDPKYDDSHFIWTRHSNNAAADAAWNLVHSTGSKKLTIGSSDMVQSASFKCTFTYDTTAEQPSQ